MGNCPVCKYSSKVETEDYGEKLKIDCPRCGCFTVTRTVKRQLEGLSTQGNDDWRWKLSYWLKKGQNQKKELYVHSNVLKKILDDINLPKPREQADNLLLWLSHKLKYPEDTISTDPFLIASVVGCKDGVGVHYVALHLKNHKYITYDFINELGNKSPTEITLGLTFEGWNKVEELNRDNISGNIAFMAMQYGDKKHNEIYKTYFKNAVAQTGFDLRRLDENLKAGLIDNQLRIEIRKARLVLADLTNDNNGAYWEAGYAEGLGKPVIYLCEHSHFEKFKTHFDTNHHTTIIWDVNKLDEALDNLKATIRATFPYDAKMNDD